MHLVQILLPRYDRLGAAFSRESFERVARELTERFGGVTAYARAPAHGVWEDASGAQEHDDIVVYEVMAERLERDWWGEYRRQLESCFEQDEIVVRALEIERL
jgi:hypothetical protein